MGDLTRERIAELRRSIGSEFDDELTLSREEAEALLSMASRCVSVETVRKLAEFNRLDAATDSDVADVLDAWDHFRTMASNDLEEAASALAKEGR
jgi:hypothetical protein